MNKKLYDAKNLILRQKKIYLFLITLIVVGVISGIVFVFFLENSDKKIISNSIDSFFKLIKHSDSINYSKSIINSLFVNVGYVVLMWLLGISVIGFPIIIGILYFKSFIIGFSISSIIMNYGLKGLIGAFLYLFPHQIIMLILYLLISFYSLSFCYKLFSHLFLKNNISFKSGMDKYIKILLIGVGITIIITLYEVFLSTYFMKIFTTFLN